MATAITATSISKDTATADLIISGGTAWTEATEAEIEYPREGKLLIVLQNTDSTTATATVAAGGYLAAGKGSLDVSLPQNDVIYLLLSSDRFKAQGAGTQATAADGKITITFASAGTGAGFIRALSLPY